MQSSIPQTGRPAEYPKEDIIQAGQELLDANRNITGFALRRKVGGGNPSRLKQIWDEHQASQSITQAEPVSELPVEVADAVAGIIKGLSDRLQALAVDLNDKTVRAAERRVAEVIKAAGDQREQAERELADASSTVEELEAKLDELKAEADGLKNQLSSSQTANQSQAVEMAQLRERLALTEQSAKAAAEQHANELDRVRIELTEQKKTNQSLVAERDQVREDLAALKAQATAAEETHQEQRKRTAEETHRNAERLTKAESEKVEAQKQAAKAREDAAKLRGQLEATQAQAAELVQALSNQQAEKTKDTKKPS